THDWLTAPSDLLSLLEDDPAPASTPHVMTKARADRTCASVAAASVLAKCERDSRMTALPAEHPDYCWADNEGYGAPEPAAAHAARHDQGARGPHVRLGRGGLRPRQVRA